MNTGVCLTVDVENWYDGMAVLGHSIDPPPGERSGLEGLLALVEQQPDARLTLFVVGGYSARVRRELAWFVDAGHEIACHGPDHGRLPEDSDRLGDWLRAGREQVEDSLQTPVVGFRSPRFDVPSALGLDRYRDVLAAAGYSYVSDGSRLGPSSPVQELPVFRWHGLPVGGGSYQRLLWGGIVGGVISRAAPPAVLYYHSYDFGATLPPYRDIRSVAEAKQLLGRRRVSVAFSRLLEAHGSVRCRDVSLHA